MITLLPPGIKGLKSINWKKAVHKSITQQLTPLWKIEKQTSDGILVKIIDWFHKHASRLIIIIPFVLVILSNHYSNANVSPKNISESLWMNVSETFFIVFCFWPKYSLVQPFQATDLFLYPPKNISKLEIIRGYKKKPVSSWVNLKSISKQKN